MIMKLIATPAAATATLAAILNLAAPPSHAATYGDAAWCLISSGGDETRRNCAYRTSQECLQALASGTRGFCDVNPYGSAAAAPARGRRR